MPQASPTGGRPQSRRSSQLFLNSPHAVRSVFALLIVAASAVAVGQVLPQGTLADLTGVPSTVALRRGGRQVAQSRRTYAQGREKRRRARVTRIAQVDTELKRLRRTRKRPTSVQVASRPATTTTPKRPPVTVAKGTTKPVTTNTAKNTPVKAPIGVPVSSPKVTVVEEAYQNVAFTFVNPRGEPVANIPLIARVRLTGEDGEVTQQEPRRFSTDAAGKVRLTGIGPLPAAVELEVAAGKTPEGAAAAEPEWRIKDAETAAILVGEPQGKKVSSALVLPRPASGVRVAAAGTGMAFSAPRQDAGEKTVERRVVYEADHPEAIAVERTVVDLAVSAPPGSRVTTSLAVAPAETAAASTNPEAETGAASSPLQAAEADTAPVVVPESGRAVLRLPVETVAAGPIPLRVSRDLPGGEAETVVEKYGVDPYRTNEIKTPAPTLVRLTDYKLATPVAVMSTRADVVRAFADLTKRDKQKEGTLARSADGSELWHFPAKGLRFKLRPTLLNNEPMVERVRVTAAQGGSVAGITPGQDAAAIAAAFGPATPGAPAPEDAKDTEAVYSYLDRGLLVGVKGGKVQWLEFARAPKLLSEGTTAFVTRGAAKLHLKSFSGNDRTNLPDEAALRRYLGRLPSVRLVDSADQADLVLDAKVSKFEEKRDNVLLKVVPFRYACETAITYTLLDKVTGQAVAQEKTVSVGAKADYSKEVAGAAVVLGLLASEGGQVGQLGALVLGGLSIRELQRSVARAVNRCPAIASATAFNRMVGDINQAANFAARVIDVDYQKGRVTLNVGKNQGIAVATADSPSEFEILIADQPLPNTEAGLSADYYTARVIEVSEDRSVCELRHIKRKVNRSKEQFEDKPDPAMVLRLPDPATGILSARASVRFPALPLVPEEGQGDKKNPAPAATTTTKAAPVNRRRTVVALVQ